MEKANINNSKSIPPSFDSSKHDAHTACYKKFTMGLNIAKGNFEGEGTSMSNNFQSLLRECEGQGKMQNNYFQNTAWFVNIVEQSKSNPRSSSHVCLPCKHQLMQLLKIVCDDKLLEREFMVHDKCYREYTRLPNDETVRCLKFHIKNANTKYLVFVSISA